MKPIIIMLLLILTPILYAQSIDDVGKKSLLLGYNAILNNNGNVLVVNNRILSKLTL